MDYPLRWESTGDHWWYASPIDLAAANGHYDLVRELLRIDGNHLIQLASLRRIRRLESIWDDDEHFDNVAKHRSHVAQKLLSECDSKRGKDSLIRGGYGGWLLYTAASAGDLSFVQELLIRDALLVFGEGEYGGTDILYAAARSRCNEVFRLLLDYALLPRFCEYDRKEVESDIQEIPSAYKMEMMNRAVHAAARGGNLMVLKELLGDCCDALAFRDAQGSTILHAAAGRGQVEVVKDLVASFNIADCSDNQGNTALHVAAHRGQLAAVEALLLASPSTMYSRNNNNGETFLHMAVTGFQTSVFRRVDQQVALMKQLVSGNLFKIEEIINVKNNDGRTALHLAIIGNIHTDLVKLLMSVGLIDVNVCDKNGMTPLDLLKQRPHSSSSELLTSQLISAGGVFNCQDYSARRIMASHLRMRSSGISPGTSFKIPDSELFLHMGIKERGTRIRSNGMASARLSAEPAKTRKTDFDMESHGPKNNTKQSSVNDTAQRLKRLLVWPKMKKKKPENIKKIIGEISLGNSDGIPVSLRQKYSQCTSLANNKRTFLVKSSVPSPVAKKKFASGLVQGLMQAIPHSTAKRRSCSSSSSKSLSSHSSLDKQKGVIVENNMAETSCCVPTVDVDPNLPACGNRKLMKRICFGTSSSQKQHEIYDQSFPSVTT